MYEASTHTSVQLITADPAVCVRHRPPSIQSSETCVPQVGSRTQRQLDTSRFVQSDLKLGASAGPAAQLPVPNKAPGLQTRLEFCPGEKSVTLSHFLDTKRIYHSSSCC